MAIYNGDFNEKTSFNSKKILIGIFLVVAVVVAIGIYIFMEVSGSLRSDKSIEITIPQGSNVSKITRQLKNEGIIGSSSIFKFYLKFYNEENPFINGEFKINPKDGYDNVVNILTNPPNNVKNKVTIIEGENLIDIAEKLEAKKVVDKAEFLEEINKDYGYKFEKYVKKENLKLFLNEGYAFPDTYILHDGITATDIAKMMLKNFDSKFKEEYYNRLEEINMSMDEVITLASIIQHEASLIKDMEMVSGIFYNRLKSNTTLPKLQSDVTVFYARDIVGEMTGNDDMITAYSTYLSGGLPVGPICNPGLDAIKAALYPKENGYLYFLTDKNGDFYYAKTLREHNINNEKAKKVNAKLENEN